MAGYASDQFYNFGGYEKNSSIGRKADDNPNFNFPGPTTPDVFNNPSGSKNVGTKMQRGFIRGIYPSVLGRVSNQSAGKVKQRRLFFQFNPTTLDRSVQMSTSVLNPLLQDPANLLQPVPGMSDFSFDILFNRESEVVSATYSDVGYKLNDSFDELASRLDNYGGSNYRQSDVATLGVLADLHVLDSIIGQSISRDMVDFLKAYWKNASNLSQQDTYESDGGSASFSFDDTAFNTTVEKNIGNSAFLSPLPIRIVFSSLFMVEGFVTYSSVQFVKFTKNYVPTICKVTLQVRALYMGFAREHAYLTDALETAVSDMVEQQKENDQLSATATKLAKYGANLIFKSPQLRMNKYNKNADRFDQWVLSGSFFDWWNAYEPSNGGNYYLEKDEFDLKGTLESSVNNGMAVAVKTGQFSWDYTLKVIISESGSKERVLAELETTYKTDSESKDLKSSDIATNANSKVRGYGAETTSKKLTNTDKYFSKGKKYVALLGDSNNTITFKYELTTSVTYTDNSGQQTATSTESRTFSAKANDDNSWLNFSNGKEDFRFDLGLGLGSGGR